MKTIALGAALALSIPTLVSAAGGAAEAVTGATPVAPPTYRSVFRDLPTGVEETALDWKNANADVAQFSRGHADWLKLEEQPGAAAPAAGAVPVLPAAPAAAPAPAPRPATGMKSAP